VVKNDNPPRPTQAEYWIENELWELIQACWDSDPHQRPTSAGLLERLENMLIEAEHEILDISSINVDVVLEYPNPESHPILLHRDREARRHLKALQMVRLSKYFHLSYSFILTAIIIAVD
jgi:hypothetical protein